MDIEPVPTTRDQTLYVQYESFSGSFEFFPRWNGRAEPTFKLNENECQERYPWVLWWKIRQNPNQRYSLS